MRIPTLRSLCQNEFLSSAYDVLVAVNPVEQAEYFKNHTDKAVRACATNSMCIVRRYNRMVLCPRPVPVHYGIVVYPCRDQSELVS